MIKNNLTRNRFLGPAQLWLATAGLLVSTSLIIPPRAVACDCDGKKETTCQDGKECECKKHKGKKSCKHCKHDDQKKADETKADASAEEAKKE